MLDVNIRMEVVELCTKTASASLYSVHSVGGIRCFESGYFFVFNYSFIIVLGWFRLV